MGSKGSATSQQTQNQSQTYAPNAQAAGYITNALQTGANAASLPFNIPQAPVAGFSQDQQNAFGLVNQAQGQAQPYYNQAASYFSPQGAQQFANPYIDSVTANLQDIFGQQMSQTTGQLTQAAGGVGADRIAVGQSELAKQQGLAAGQTYSQIYQNAAQNAQAAGYGTANLGQASQNSAFQGANQLLGTGGLQQQLSQAQLNSPYQQQLAQAAFPYQNAQFLAGITGALAPGLGGTTSGQSQTNGTQTPAQPSIWSQLLGAGTAAAGIYGGFSGGSGGTGKGATSMNGQLTTPQSVPGYMSAARGGVINPYAEGGGVSDDPIDISKSSIIPTGQLQPIQAHIPQLNFSQPQQQQSGSGSGGKGGGIGIGDIAKVAMMFANRGGAVDAPGAFARGGSPDDFFGLTNGDPAWADPDVGSGYAMPYAPPGSVADRGAFDYFGNGSKPNPSNAYAAMPDAVPMPRPRPAGANAAAGDAEPTQALGFAGPDAAPSFPGFAPKASPAENPYSAPEKSGDAGQDFAKSPWAALTAAGLGIMGGTSPFAGVNIGQGAQAGLKTLQTQRETAQKDTTIAQSAKRLEQEAKFHEDQFNRKTMGQQILEKQADRPYKELTAAEKQAADRQDRLDDLAEKRFNRPYEELTKAEQATLEQNEKKNALEGAKPFTIGVDRNGFEIKGVRDPNNPGRYLDAVTGKPVEPSRVRGAAAAQPAAAADADGAVPANKAMVAAGAFNYAEAAPPLEKGMDIPEPAAVGYHSPRSLQTDAEAYLHTGKLPPGPRGGKSPTAIQENDYVNAVRNYAGAIAQSRGITPEQAAEMRVTAPGLLRFVLGQDGRATVSLGTAVRHLDTLRELSAAWKAGDMQKINQLRAVMSREFGGAAGTNLESAAGLIGPEIIKALGVAGAGTSQERDHAGSQFSTARSPEQLIGAIDTTQKLLGGQLEGKMRQAAASGVSEEKFKGLIGDRPFEILKNADKGAPGAAPTKTIARQGVVNSGPNAGKKVIEYSDGTREFQ